MGDSIFRMSSITIASYRRYIQCSYLNSLPIFVTADLVSMNLDKALLLIGKYHAFHYDLKLSCPLTSLCEQMLIFNRIFTYFYTI